MRLHVHVSLSLPLLLALFHCLCMCALLSPSLQSLSHSPLSYYHNIIMYNYVVHVLVCKLSGWVCMKLHVHVSSFPLAFKGTKLYFLIAPPPVQGPSPLSYNYHVYKFVDGWEFATVVYEVDG